MNSHSFSLKGQKTNSNRLPFIKLLADRSCWFDNIIQLLEIRERIADKSLLISAQMKRCSRTSPGRQINKKTGGTKCYGNKSETKNKTEQC